MKFLMRWSIIIVAILLLLPRGCDTEWRDETDPPGKGVSGLTLYKDAGTGCQYVGVIGALTPRMDASGKQVCKP